MTSFLFALPLSLAITAFDGSDDAHRAGVAKANEAVARVKSRAEADPRRPAYHFLAPARWMNDPNGPIYYKGEYHLFYQHNPYGDDWGHMHWGHAKSKDLVHWQHLPIALAPSLDKGEEHCFSGSAIIAKDGTPTVFYTSIGPKTPADRGAVQWAATSRDGLLTWQKHPLNPILTEKVHGDTKVLDWRDPFVWRQGDVFYMVIGGHKEGGKGAAFLYRSNDLVKWEYLNVLCAGEEANWECPNFFKLGSKWVLIYSPHAAVRYLTGDWGDDHVFRPETRGTLDLSQTYYAPNGLVDANGRRILWGWVRVKGDGWNGCFSLPRVLTMRPDGQLGQAPAPELEALRREKHHLDSLTVQPSAAVKLDGVNGDCLELALEIDLGDALAIGIRRPGSSEPIVLVDRARKRLVSNKEEGEFAAPNGAGKLQLRVFLDRSLVEIFADGRAGLTAPLAPSEHPELELFTLGGTARVTRLDAWELKP